MTQESQSFHVDLRGIVDLLSQHLYSSPRVYVRELVQNAADAITARRLTEPDAPARIRIVPADVSPDGCLHVEDTGCGLDEGSIRRVLSTIGASSKRDELGFARDSFLGQFGIGLLACFLVSDEIVVTTRADGGTETWTWVGRADGTYDVRRAPEPRGAVGTEVVLRPRPGTDGELLGAAALELLVSEYAAYLPVEIVVETPRGPRKLGSRCFPWDGASAGAARRAAGIALAERHLGFTPLDVVELADPQSGVRGMAFVLPYASGARGGHRVHAKGMLVSDREDTILPDWAFFARAVVDADGLSLTASREALHDDEARREATDRLGDQLRRWLLRLGASDPTRMREFLRVHHLGAKAMAVDDPAMLELVATVLPWQTSLGDMTLAEFAGLDPVMSYVTSTSDFQQVAAVAQSLGTPVLNAGYAYDEAIVAAWLRHHPGSDARAVSPQDLVAQFEQPDEEERRRFARLLDVATEALSRSGCRPELRAFRPESRHALLLADRAGLRRLDRIEVRHAAEGPWAAALDGVAERDDRPAFVLNAANDAVRRLAHADDDLQRTAVEALYAHALLAAQHPLRPFDAALVGRALPALINRAIDGGRS